MSERSADASASVVSQANAYPPPHELRLLKISYFALFATLACFLPFLPLYFESLNLGEEQIGIVISIRPYVSFIGAPVLSGFADAHGTHRAVFFCCTMISGFLRVAVGFTSHTGLLVCLVALSEFIAAPLTSFVDEVVLSMLRSHPKLYGQQRLWGAVGWGIAAPLVGLIVGETSIRSAFLCFAICAILSIVVLMKLDWECLKVHHPVPNFEQDPNAMEPTSSFCHRLGRVLRSRDIVLFLMAVMSLGMCMGMIDGFLSLYLQSLGAPPVLFGLSLTFMCIGELPFFFYAKAILVKLGTNGVLLVVFACYVIRLLLYASLRNPWAVLPIELLHGITFAAMWSACVDYAKQCAPPGLGSTLQGILTGTFFGLGPGTGAAVGGILISRYGFKDAFLLFAAGAAIGLVLFAGQTFLLHRYGNRSRKYGEMRDEVDEVKGEAIEMHAK